MPTSRLYREGKATISSGGAFVNDAAKLTRDVGVAIAALNGPGLSVLDPTAATGLRGIRYCLEAKAGKCTMLEINPTAYKALRANISRNKVAATAINTSIQEFANSCREKFDVIDLDPFGGVQPYVYDLMKVAKDGTLFFATATDTAVLCGAHHAACVRLYNAVPMHNELCKEAGLRILTGHIARIAAQFNFGVEPLLTMNYKHYMRVHLRLRHGAASANESMKNIGFMSHCAKCMERGTQRGLVPKELSCESCGSRLMLSGPLWIGKMQDKKTLQGMCTAISGDSGTLERLCGELDTPCLYSIPKITKALGIKSVSPAKVISYLEGHGHRATVSHFDASYIRADVSAEEVKAAALAIASGKD